MDEKKLIERIENLERQLELVTNKKSCFTSYLKKCLTKTNIIIGVMLSFILASTLIYAIGTLISFTDGTIISAAEVNTNFTTVYNAVAANEASISTINANQSLFNTQINVLNTRIMRLDDPNLSYMAEQGYLGVFGFANNESDVAFDWPFGITITSIKMTTKESTLNVSTLVTLRVDGVATSNTTSIGAGATGDFELISTNESVITGSHFTIYFDASAPMSGFLRLNIIVTYSLIL